MANLAIAPLMNLPGIHMDALVDWGEWNVLVVSGAAENSALLRILEKLPVAVSVASTIEEAHEFLASRKLDVVFCEESLPDGSYRRILLESSPEKRRCTRFVVMLRTEGWDASIEAMRLGAAEVLKRSLQPIDVELVLIRAGRERIKQGFDVMA